MHDEWREQTRRNARAMASEIERLNGIQEVDGSIPFSSTTIDSIRRFSLSARALRTHFCAAAQVERHRHHVTVFETAEQRRERLEAVT